MEVAPGISKGRSTQSRSRSSVPSMASSTMDVSCRLRHMGPSLSIDQDNAIAPWRDTRPKVGRSDEFPQRVEGLTMEPRVSEPMAKGSAPAPTAAADPADEPLEPRSVFHGDNVLPPYQISPIASAPRVVFAIRMAPALSSFFTTVASVSIT